MMCSQMGGPSECTFEVSGNSAAEMVEAGTKHVMESHPDILAQMNAMSDEEKAKWFVEFQAKFDAAPEVV